jgi:hypothetical protein
VVEYPKNPDTLQLEVGGPCAHPADGAPTAGVVETPAAPGQASGAVQSGQPLLQPCWAVVAAHYHWKTQNH